MAELRVAVCLVYALVGASGLASGSPALRTLGPVTVPGKAAAFDFMAVDAKSHRLLAAHKGAKTLTVVDLASEQPLAEVSVGSAQGVAVFEALDAYVVGAEDEAAVIMVDRKSLVPTTIKVPGPVDAVAVDSKRGMIYADKDGAGLIWVVDPKAKKTVATIHLAGEPEYVAYDEDSDLIYQSIKTKDSVVVIDPSSNKVVATWSTLPAKGPHGLAVDARRGRLYVAGQNGQLVAINLKDGKVLATAAIGMKVDQIALDPGAAKIYAGCRGAISAVQITDAGLTPLGDTPAPMGAKTLAVDSQTHAVWVSYADAKHSYVQKFSPQP